MQYVWGEANTTSQGATPQRFGMAQKDGHAKTSKDVWQPQKGWSSVLTGNSPGHAPAPPTPKSTYVQAVERPAMEPRSAPEEKRLEDNVQEVVDVFKLAMGTSSVKRMESLRQRKEATLTPYHASAWI